MRPAIGSACVIAIALAGCASVGPPTIERDRFDYVTTISDSWKRQMVLNLLKIRYTDAPVFMDVTSVISSYSLEGEISLFGQYAAARTRRHVRRPGCVGPVYGQADHYVPSSRRGQVREERDGPDPGRGDPVPHPKRLRA